MQFYNPNIDKSQYVIATYYMRSRNADLRKTAWDLAIGQSVGNITFHFYNLRLVVCLICDVHVITKLGRINLLILGRDGKRSYTHELKLRATHAVVLKEPVDDVNSQVECLRDLRKE